MSGTNRLINSDNTIKGNSVEALNKKLLNANEEAIKINEIETKRENMPEDRKDYHQFNS